jgi:myosin-1
LNQKLSLAHSRVICSLFFGFSFRLVFLLAVRHQVRYLGLLENVRVRRAGFAFRQEYDRFLWRYKMTSKDTWPNSKDGRTDAPKILAAQGIPAEEYRLGKTKVFIRQVSVVTFILSYRAFWST